MTHDTSSSLSPNPDGYVYLDAAATSWPKPPEVVEAVTNAISMPLGNPGRAGHVMAVNAGRLVLEARETVSDLFGISDPSRLVFTKNATEALNTGILGSLKPGQHVVTSSMEHNSVMRPLRHLEALGAELTVVQCSEEGKLDPDDIDRAIRSNTRLVVLTHASNVNGVLMPVERVSEICRSAGVVLLVDASQTAGTMPIAAEELGIDLLAFSGHKGLLGPTGTGGLYVREGIELEPLMRGGTGSLSDEEIQPDFLPDALESGTVNVVGLAGLAAGTRYLQKIGLDKIREHEVVLSGRLLKGLRAINVCRIHGPTNPDHLGGALSFTLEGLTPSEIGRVLDVEYKVMTRVGLHCAPIAHKTLGTFPTGTVRLGWGLSNTIDEIDHTVNAIRDIAARIRTGGRSSIGAS